MTLIKVVSAVATREESGTKASNVLIKDRKSRWSAKVGDSITLDLGSPQTVDFVNIAWHKNRTNVFDVETSSDNKTFAPVVNDHKSPANVESEVVKFPNPVTTQYIRITGVKSTYKDWISIDFIEVGNGVVEPTPGPNPNPGPNPPNPPTNPEGYIKPGGWGASKDPATWKAVVMKDNSQLWKVVDTAGKNVATDFKSEANALKYIKDAQGNNPPPNPPPGPVDPPQPGGNGVDKNGVKLLLSSGKEINYEVKNNFRDDGKRFDLKVGDWSQSEATGYFRFTKDPVDDEVSIKWSVVSHSGNNEVKCYDSGISIKNGKARLRWENPHPEYSGSLGSGQGQPLPAGKWIGYKGTKTVGSDGSVTIKLYQDTGDNETKPSNQWKEIFSHTDTKYKETGPHPYVTLRIDDPGKNGQKNLEAKWISVAKI